jgi:thiamine kinase-like enzyme
MVVRMAARYRYVCYGRQFICIDQKVRDLARLLLFEDRSLRLFSLSERKRKRRAGVRSFIRHLLFRWRKSGRFLDLPIFGNICSKVHRGYKAFDFRRGSATKLYSADVDPAIIARDIESARTAGELGFGPRVRNWSVEERWYEEEFVNGDLESLREEAQGEAFLGIYRLDLAPLHERMVLAREPRWTGLRAYLSTLTEGIEGALRGLESRRGVLEVEEEKIEGARRFLETALARLEEEEDQELPLVFSHGDFCIVNAIRTSERVVLIDWESCGERSVLHDLFNAFLAESYRGRAVAAVAAEIPEAIDLLLSGLRSRAPRLARSIEDLGGAYRWLYYIERMHMISARDLNRRLYEMLVGMVSVFEAYEQQSVGVRVPG